MANKHPIKQIQEYREAFRLFDKNNDGKISSTELETLLTVLGQKPTKEQLAEMIANADKDGNGTIEFTEFISLMTTMKNSQNEMQELQMSFQFFDRNGDGFITANELYDAMHHIGRCITEDELDEMMQAADTDGDGKVTFEEFVRLMVRKEDS